MRNGEEECGKKQEGGKWNWSIKMHFMNMRSAKKISFLFVLFGHQLEICMCWLCRTWQVGCNASEDSPHSCLSTYIV